VIYCYNSHSAIVQLFHGENKLIFNEMRFLVNIVSGKSIKAGY
jgi:hypothetical protein